MTKIKYFVAMAAVVFALSSCGGSGEHNHSHGKDGHEHHEGDGHDHSNHEHHDGDGHNHDKEHASTEGKTLKLNDGNKWKSDSATHMAYSQMQDLMVAFAEKGDADKNYADLGMMLSAQTDATIAACSMTGPNHDNLHLVLEPLIGEINELKSNDAAKGKAVATKVEALIKAYFEHFEL